ncbi:MAG: 50S ribosomal protein L30 [Anaerolineae bacterium]|nr:50S ribosomal protein L30 [Anaerolineae bacterium]
MAKKKTEQPTKMLRIKLIRSPIGNTQKHKDTIRTLGLRKINQVVERPDTPSLRGMLLLVNHMVAVEEVEN